jgi:hypothetical protein
VSRAGDGHYDVWLSAEDSRPTATWIDGNAVFHAAYRAKEQARQLQAEGLPLPAFS